MMKSDETEPLLDKRNEEAPRGWLLLMFYTLVGVGDAVEFHLPGVITQEVSCDLGISHFKEGMLATSMYLFEILGAVTSYFISEKIGRKHTLLLSFYLCIISTVFCAVVPNYTVLLCSRCFIGLSIGLNDNTVSVYFSELVVTRATFRLGKLLFTVGYAFGAGWIGVLGYVLLDTVGWRIFVLLTSIPFFLPPIVMLHFCLPESQSRELSDKTEKSRSMLDNLKKIKVVPVVKFGLIWFVAVFHCAGAVLLLPKLLRETNKNTAEQTPNSPEDMCHTIKGIQFLSLAVVYGICGIVGRIAAHLVRKVANFSIMSLFSFTALVSYCFMLFLQISSDWAAVPTEIALGITRAASSGIGLEMYSISSDRKVLGGGGLNAASTILILSALVGALWGNILPAFFSSFESVLVCIVLGVVQLGIMLSVENDI